MAVADVEKVEKIEKAEKAAKSQAGGSSSGGNGGGPFKQAFDWLPNKWRQLRSFLAEVRAELKKVTWPSRTEVYSTTIVVMATTVFFGFYLWGLDLVFSRVLQQVLKR